jgi:ribosomal protein L12E/L44/L45/RPP1/RPP2
MPFTSLSTLDDNTKQEFVASLSALIVGKAASEEGEVSGEKIEAVATASGNKVSAAYASLWASVVDKAGGVTKFTAGPGSGGGGAGGAAGGDAGAAEAVVEEKEEEEEMDMAGGMDMFGGEEEGGSDY